MTRIVVVAAVATAAAVGLSQASETFQPFQPRAYRLVNGVAFDGSEERMFFALLTREVLAHRGRPDSTAPETSIYSSQRAPNGWSEPVLAPFSGSFPDYEPTLAIDGSFLVFNSRRPYPDGRRPARNDLYLVERREGTWSTPRPVVGINSFDLEESYATVDSARRVIFVKGPAREGTDDFDLYEFTLGADGTASEPLGLPFSGPEFGEGDPQLARNGSFLIFTRWDHRVGWQQTCDLYLSFRTSLGWTEPVPLTELNTPTPDYAAALSPDGQWLYYRAGGRYLRRLLRPVLDSALARTRCRSSGERQRNIWRFIPTVASSRVGAGSSSAEALQMFDLRLSRYVWFLSVASIAACSDSDEPTQPPRALYVNLSQQAKVVLQGDSVTFQANLSSNQNFSSVPQLTIPSTPVGMVARINIIQSSTNIASALIIIHVSAQVTPDTYVLSLVASEPGVSPVTVPFALTVMYKQPPCTLTDLCPQWAAAARASSQYTPDEWSSAQAIGAPNVIGCSDDPHAWASADVTDAEWLEVDFEHSVFPTRVDVYENLTVSGIVKVELRDELSRYHTIYTATPRVLGCPRVLSIPVTNIDVKVKGVRITIDQVTIGYWNEIDAVELVGYRQR